MSSTESEPGQPLDPAELGMTCGSKNLYSGKEDKRGRFHWQESIPEDIGEPVENAETAKYALIVRNVKVYNDPRRVLKIHSIVIQSPLLKQFLTKVLKDYPGVTVDLARLEFSGIFEPLIHRWQEMQEAIAALSEDSEDDRKTREHAQLLFDILLSEFQDTIETSQDMKSKGVITYEYLWTLFQPGEIIYARQDGQETALKLASSKYGTDRNNLPCYWVTGKYIDFDGSRFGTQKINHDISAFSGTRRICSLGSYPLSFHTEPDLLKARLIERGGQVESLSGNHYKAYHGIGWRRSTFTPGRDKYNIKGRIVIDTYGWNRFNPNQAIYVTPLSSKENDTATPGLGSGEATEETEDEDYDSYEEEDCGDSGMPRDGRFSDENDEMRRKPLTDEQKLICSPLLRGYALKNKLWLNFFIGGVREIEWSETAFDSLVLPANQKELILGFTESQRKYKESFDDVIEGKGKGIIMLLCGPPGVGKTLTAESVAEEMKVPLYTMSAGDLGLDPRNVETKLQNILEMCTKWNAILLLDEADVFLEERSLHELERNKLVTIFLRILEYYEGIMFLTTNRVQTFDAAFQSRIHISLNYQDLNAKARETVWTNFLESSKKSGIENSLTEKQVKKLAEKDMNGRQIKNILKTAQLLARRREQILGYEHMETVLEVTQHLHQTAQQSKRTQDTLYH
ncbi:P-loop containing nucleoside triphosphate hydrolase protein [Eremomyces bilateralis CBS 781.70]|uniref:P-loop containing nucleoside triphosphate hydrolase protein n=1 Tax=Eremomyces bilateralis CBS 781.70 TaxID=1392243 RepID=A0A6G1FUL1_9PEZI|nr:P-loop containing nucleoside triphosphate hydrolase protein [Eremomyces bilateralis CBS 781.70]KAF1809396.1 P-loop containing nucleoside triphosphate hydrolase protein [Eremomyces bilateralis CBS 781.70]